MDMAARMFCILLCAMLCSCESIPIGDMVKGTLNLDTDIEDGVEAKIDRKDVWYVGVENSGIEAWKFGYTGPDSFQYIDSNSPIIETSPFSATGYATYLTKGQGFSDYAVKTVDFRDSGEPEEIGQLEKVRGEVRLSTINGEIYAARKYFLTSRGVVLARNDNVFSYLPFSPQVQTLPAGWTFAWYQFDDIETTRLIAIKRPLKMDLSHISNPNYEIGFYNIDTQHTVATVTMNISKRNESESFKSRFYMFSTKSGPISVAVEDGLRRVVVRNLRTGESREAFSRDLGIGRLWVKRASTGRIQIIAAVGLTNGHIFDAEDFLENGRMESL